MRFGVVVFPGSNCDLDAYYLVRDVVKQPVDYLWHGDRDLKGSDCVILPGGFSYGDYLRPGAIARFSPIMEAIKEFAGAGGLVLGICNGFQVLVEAGLLPGALMRNDCLQFRCQMITLKVENASLPFTCKCCPGELLRLPVAHGDGCYYADSKELEQMEERGQVVFRYVNHKGEAVPEANPNGSVANIAGICNRRGNVLGMMPHPERAGEEILGSTDGLKIFVSLLKGVLTCR